MKHQREMSFCNFFSLCAAIFLLFACFHLLVSVACVQKKYCNTNCGKSNEWCFCVYSLCVYLLFYNFHYILFFFHLLSTYLHIRAMCVLLLMPMMMMIMKMMKWKACAVHKQRVSLAEQTNSAKLICDFCFMYFSSVLQINIWFFFLKVQSVCVCVWTCFFEYKELH